jgi:CheY-like chemotaxis protein
MGDSAKGGTMKILIVDDELGIRTMVASTLKRIGYDTIVASDGAEALQLLGCGLVVDALITDIRMPGADGWTVARAYREQLPELPVLYVTGQTDDMLPVPGGVLIKKPFRMSQILTALSTFTQSDGSQWRGMAGAA